MTKFKQDYDRIQELDSGRTGADYWAYRFQTVHNGEYEIAHTNTDAPHTQINAQFIAAAPQMAEMLRQQQELLEEAAKIVGMLEKDFGDCGEDWYYGEYSKPVDKLLTKLKPMIGEDNVK